MRKELEQIAIIGLGKFGMSVAKLLSKYDCDVLAIDDSDTLIEEAVPYVTRAIKLNAVDTEALKAVGIKNFDIAIVGIGDNIEASLMINLTLKELGIPKIIAKARDEKHAKLLEMIGVDKIVQPEIDSAVRLVNTLSTKYVKEKMELSKDYSMVEVETPKIWVGKTFSELALRQKHSINVVCVKRNGEVEFPTANYMLQENDSLMVMASNKELEILDSLYNE
ncbi:MAG: TrkA family potassium uptake protein [Clostridia bacterium]|nr:TrkA family potassium uptake protein [Clostridia bacterium]